MDRDRFPAPRLSSQTVSESRLTLSLDPLGRNLEPRLAQPVRQVFDEVGVPPLQKLFSRSRRKLRFDGEKLAEGSRRRVSLPELAVCGGESKVQAPESGHLDLPGRVHGRLVV